MLGKAQEWKLIHVAPRLKLLEENEREVVIDGETEAKLLAHLRQPALDVFVIVQDTGLRPDEVFRMRVEDVNWSSRIYFNASGKTKRARRPVALSQRVLDLLFVRCGCRTEGWIFPSRRSRTGHLVTVAKKFREARKAAGIPRSIILYAARHTYGTFVYQATKNLKVVMDSMGHSDVRTTMRYQHPELEQVRIAIDERNAQRHNSRHSDVVVQ
jgi:integrase